jgi:DNA-binding MarR family transcriptional regulator
VVTLVRPLERATHQAGLHLQAALADLGLSQAEIHVLAHLAADGPSSAGDLHRGFGHRRSTLTSVLDRLEARGFVSRAVDPRDRRSLIVSTTVDGAPVASRVLAAVEALERRVGDATSAAEREGYLAVLDALGRATAP